MTDILAKIDAATDGLCACGCERAVPPDGLSAWFAGEGCQRRWSAARTDRPDEVLNAADAHLVVPRAMLGYHDAGAAIDVQANMRASIEAIISGIRHFGEVVRPTLESLQRLFADIEASKRPADDGPTDPMERALWLRKNRNTGPKQHRRAPRNLGVGRR